MREAEARRIRVDTAYVLAMSLGLLPAASTTVGEGIKVGTHTA